MTRDEAIKLMQKQPEELTGRDVESLQHLAKMLEWFPDYLDTLESSPPPPEYVDVTPVDGVFVQRIKI